MDGGFVMALYVILLCWFDEEIGVRVGSLAVPMSSPDRDPLDGSKSADVGITRERWHGGGRDMAASRVTVFNNRPSRMSWQAG